MRRTRSPIAGLTKFMRTFGLLVLVPAAAMWMARAEAAVDKAHPEGLRRDALPGFVIAFIALVGVRTAGDIWMDGPAWQAFLRYAQQASELLLLCGMAAVGLGITFAHLRESGWRPLRLLSWPRRDRHDRPRPSVRLKEAQDSYKRACTARCPFVIWKRRLAGRNFAARLRK